MQFQYKLQQGFVAIWQSDYGIYMEVLITKIAKTIQKTKKVPWFFFFFLNTYAGMGIKSVQYWPKERYWLVEQERKPPNANSIAWSSVSGTGFIITIYWAAVNAT